MASTAVLPASSGAGPEHVSFGESDNDVEYLHLPRPSNLVKHSKLPRHPIRLLIKSTYHLPALNDTDHAAKLSYLRSPQCRQHLPSATTISCGPCGKLLLSTRVIKMNNRIHQGCHDNTKTAYLSPAQLIEVIRRKTAKKGTPRLSSLNRGRALASRSKEIDGHKRILLAVASGKVSRVHASVWVVDGIGIGIPGDTGAAEPSDG